MVRHKNRYLVIEINECEPNKDGLLILKGNSLFNAVTQAISNLHGDFGLAAVKAGFISKYCNEKTRLAVIRARHGPHKLVASALPFVTEIERKKVDLRTLYTGATIKQCFNFIVQYQQNKLDLFCLDLKSDEEKLILKEQILNYDKVLEIT